MKKQPPLWLLILLIMFPQLVETIYSPALPSIACSFDVSHEQSSQTLSVYFFAFALGVALWGWLSDWVGRRPAMLLGLMCYACGAVLATFTTDFNILLLARMVSALGAAAGSVVVQTMLRDSYESNALARVFSVLGAALAISPVFGLMSGGWLVSQYGYMGVFIGLFIFAIGLFVVTAVALPETRPPTIAKPALLRLGSVMLRDSGIWSSILLISLFNTMIFGYYSLAPFLFGHLGWGARAFGWTGALLAIFSLWGSFLNRRMLMKGWKIELLIRYTCLFALLCSSLVFVLQDSIWFLAPMMGIVITYSIVIPNVLSCALTDYRQNAGTAGAILGLTYYLLLSVMLAIAGAVQNLGLVLTVCAFIAGMLTVRKRLL
ncbi:multidrug effflux MFS transporter [Acinetobacter sp.]|uniref:multidrug effflux MFS transporter n=1 Tax=Acinetobacter sp. TaxID=472 RepID=UPI0031E35D00